MSARKAVLLRLDTKLHDALRRWADDELRSVNAQLEFLIRDALVRARRLGPARPHDPGPSAGDGEADR